MYCKKTIFKKNHEALKFESRGELHLDDLFDDIDEVDIDAVDKPADFFEINLGPTDDYKTLRKMGTKNVHPSHQAMPTHDFAKFVFDPYCRYTDYERSKMYYEGNPIRLFESSDVLAAYEASKDFAVSPIESDLICKLRKYTLKAFKKLDEILPKFPNLSAGLLNYAHPEGFEVMRYRGTWAFYDKSSSPDDAALLVSKAFEKALSLPEYENELSVSLTINNLITLITFF
jgi:hypothetical protein